MVKRILFVLSGVSAEKYEQAKETVIKEFDKIKSGDFDSNKIELAKKSLFLIDTKHQIDPKV